MDLLNRVMKMISRRVGIGILSVFCFCIGVISLPAKAIADSVMLADATLDGKILEFHWPAEQHGARYTISWGSREQYHQVIRLAQGGVNRVDLRSHPHWEGQVSGVILDIKPISYRLVEPNWRDEFGIFMSPEILSSQTSNFLWGHTFLKLPTVFWIGLAAVGVLFILRFVFRRSWQTAFFISLVLAFSMTDIRSMYDHFQATQTRSLDQKAVDYVKQATQLFGPQIGDRSWSLDGVIIPYNFLLKYHLAEYQQFPDSKASQADVVIRQHPNRELYIQTR